MSPQRLTCLCVLSVVLDARYLQSSLESEHKSLHAILLTDTNDIESLTREIHIYDSNLWSYQVSLNVKSVLYCDRFGIQTCRINFMDLAVKHDSNPGKRLPTFRSAVIGHLVEDCPVQNSMLVYMTALKVSCRLSRNYLCSDATQTAV
jgi:hypothetical protein